MAQSAFPASAHHRLSGRRWLLQHGQRRRVLIASLLLPRAQFSGHRAGAGAGEYVAAQITGFLSEVLPPGTEQAVLLQFSNKGGKPIGLLIFANILALWAASSVIKSLIEGFHAAYRVPRNRDFFHSSGVAMLLVIAAGLPFAAASTLVLFGQETEGQVLQWFRVDPMLNPLAILWEFLSRIARYAVAILATISLTTILYYFAPYRRQRFRLVIPGAIFATVLWMLATLGFGWYVRNVSNYNVLYGSIGTGIALLVWMYLLCAIAILGCEFNAEYERMISIDHVLPARSN